MRADTLRNRKLVLEAYTRLAYTDAEAIDVASVSAESGVSVASIYRYFGSIDKLADTFRENLINDFVEVAYGLDTTAPDFLKQVCSKWWQFIDQHSVGLISARSKKGYLKRLAADSSDIAPLARCVSIGIQNYADHNHITPDINLALYEWNKEFDPRDVKDLIDNTEYTSEVLFQLTYDGYVNKLKTKCQLETASGNNI